MTCESCSIHQQKKKKECHRTPEKKMSSNPSSSSSGGPCGACKFLRRKCVPGCIFAPYFDSEEGAAHFSAVHKVFGASNVSKLLLHIPVHKRFDAVLTICYEAQARLRDPVYGCVAHLFTLQQQVVSLQAEISYLQAHLTTSEVPTPPPQTIITQTPSSIAELPSATYHSVPSSTYHLSSIFEPTMSQTSWGMQRSIDPRQFGGASSGVGGGPSLTRGGNSGGDLQA